MDLWPLFSWNTVLSKFQLSVANYCLRLKENASRCWEKNKTCWMKPVLMNTVKKNLHQHGLKGCRPKKKKERSAPKWALSNLDQMCNFPWRQVEKKSDMIRQDTDWSGPRTQYQLVCNGGQKHHAIGLVCFSWYCYFSQGRSRKIIEQNSHQILYLYLER